MELQEDKEKEKEIPIPQCKKCSSRGYDCQIKEDLCWICRVEENPEGFGLPKDFSLIAEFEKRLGNKIPKIEFDPTKDIAKDAWIKETQ